MLSFSISNPLQAQSDTDTPVFRPRTDSNAKQDLELLRQALNRAADSQGDINPLGKFLQRNEERLAVQSEQDKPSPIELRQIESKKDVVQPDRIEDKNGDRDADEKPRLVPKTRKQDATSGASTDKSSTSTVEVLPGPRYTIIQQVSPQFSRTIVDDFHPMQEYPVSLAASGVRWNSPANNYLANFQDIPGTGAMSSSSPQGPVSGFPSGYPGGFVGSPAGDPAANVAPVLPSNTGSSGIYPGISASPNVNSAPTFAQPQFSQPQINQPQVFPGQPQSYYPAIVPGSPSDVPRYPQQPTAVNGLPFVTSGPCPRDARFMVSREAYRQSVDPCAQTRCGPTAYAPYAGQPGGSGLSYVPPTYMNNTRYNTSYRPLIGFGQTLDNASLGRGIIGQPVAYVDGQPVRNFMRYLFP